MSFLSRVFSVLLVVVGLSQVNPVRAQQVGQYMQLFYYGPQVGLTSPIGRFSPAFKGKSEILLAKQDEFMKQMSPSFSASTTTSSGEMVAESIEKVDAKTGEVTRYVKGKKLTPAEAEKYDREQSARQDAKEAALLKQYAQHTENVTNELTKALNEAAADGWEVVQMASLPNSGLVYLMRKVK